MSASENLSEGIDLLQRVLLVYQPGRRTFLAGPAGPRAGAEGRVRPGAGAPCCRRREGRGSSAAAEPTTVCGTLMPWLTPSAPRAARGTAVPRPSARRTAGLCPRWQGIV